MRIFWLFNHPAPYKVELFSRLGKQCDLTVFFERAKEGERNKAFYDVDAASFTRVDGHPVLLGGTDNYTKEPLRYLNSSEKYDLIILNGWSTFTERKAIRYCQKRHIPYIFYINGGIVPEKEGGFKRRYKSSFIQGASFYLAPDERSKKYLLHYGAREDQIVLYPYGSVAEQEVLSKPYDIEGVAKLRSKLGIEGRRAFVSAGFFIKRKAFDTLIRFFAHMPKDDHLYLIGEGKEKKNYLRLIESLGLKNVHVLPYMSHSELFRFYRACDAFLFSSREDIYAHVITEALSQGLPVYSAPNVNAAHLLLKKGYNGGIVDFDDPKVAEELANTDFRSLKENAISSIASYTYEASAKAHMEIFADIVERLKQ